MRRLAFRVALKRLFTIWTRERARTTSAIRPRPAVSLAPEPSYDTMRRFVQLGSAPDHTGSWRHRPNSVCFVFFVSLSLSLSLSLAISVSLSYRDRRTTLRTVSHRSARHTASFRITPDRCITIPTHLFLAFSVLFVFSSVFFAFKSLFAQKRRVQRQNAKLV